MNVDEKWSRRTNKITRLPNQFNLIDVNSDSIKDTFSIDVNFFTENEYKFKENPIPSGRDTSMRDLMYANKQDKERLYFKKYDNVIKSKRVIPVSKIKDFKKTDSNNNTDGVIKFDIIKEVSRGYQARPKLYKDAELNRQFLRENPQYNKDIKVDYIIDRYYFI